MSVTCRGCGKTIVWGIGENGKRIPLDPTPAVYDVPEVPDVAGELHVTRNRRAMVIHFSTCPKASDFSKGRKP